MPPLRLVLGRLLFQAARVSTRLGVGPLRAVARRLTPALLEGAIRVNPEIDHPAHVRLGVLHARAGDPVAAEAAFDRGLARHPDRPMLHFHRGHALMAQRRYRDAIDALTRAVHLDPDQAILWQDLEYAVGRADAAADHLGAARALAARHSGHALARRHLGNTLARLEKFEESATAYRAASEVQLRASRPDLTIVGDARRAPVPDILLIGPSRCGKSTLYRHLIRHPRVLSALYEEMNYWVDRREPGLAWYRSQFPPVAPGDAVTIHTGTPYLHDRLAAGRFAAGCPDAKVVIVLRNPVVRAYAHYFQGRSLGRVDRSWPDLVADWLTANGARPADEIQELDGPAYISAGVYEPGVRRWLEAVAPSRLLVVRSEQLFEDPTRVLEEVGGFVGLDDVRPSRSAPARGLHRHDTDAPAATQRALEEYYRPHNRALEELLGRRLGW